MNNSLDVRELTFQNVIDQILKPKGVKVGGFPDDMFLELSDKEKELYTCNICYMILKEARECSNKHLFCHTCIFAWSLTYGENSQKCPVCRNRQIAYRENLEVNKSLNDKRVKCPEEGCTYKSPLKFFLYHRHGKEKFSNSHVDLESIRPDRTSPAGIFFLPRIGEPATGTERVAMMRSSFEQGRVLIHQMFFLLHLEMQLRQRNMQNIQQAQNASNRLARLDDVLALNEQLNEVGTILSSLMSQPLASIRSSNESRTGTLTRFNSSDTDEDSDSDMSTATVVPRESPVTNSRTLREAPLSTLDRDRSTNNQSSRINANAPNIRSSTSNTESSTSTLTSTSNLQTIQRVIPRPQPSNTEPSVTATASQNTVNPRQLLDGTHTNSSTTQSETNTNRNTNVQITTDRTQSHATSTSQGRVLNRTQIQNTISGNQNNVISDSREESNGNEITNGLPPIENLSTAREESNLPRGNDAYSRTIRELAAEAENIGQSENRQLSTNNSAVLSRPNSVSRNNQVLTRSSISNSTPTRSRTQSSSNTVSNSGSSRPNNDNNTDSSSSHGTNRNTRNQHSQSLDGNIGGRSRSVASNQNTETNNRRRTSDNSSLSRSTDALPSRSVNGSYAPQRRFRREGSNQASGSQQHTPSDVQSSSPVTGTTSRAANNRRNSIRGNRNYSHSRSTSGSTVSSSNPSSNSTTVPRNLSRDAMPREETPTTVSVSNQQRSRTRANNNRGPSTLGQLLRARRRSEIMQDLMRTSHGEKD